MKRGEFLAATGLDLINYKNLRHRGQLPLYQHVEGHTDFSVADAVRGRVMREAMRVGPARLNAEAAQWFTINVWNVIHREWGSDLEGLRSANLWIGVSVGDDFREYFVSGTIEACAAELAQGGQADRMFLINVSREVDQVLRRVGAQEAGDA